MVSATKRKGKKWGLSADCPVYSCCKAGRDGFWIHCCLIGMGIKNVVMDPSRMQAGV